MNIDKIKLKIGRNSKKLDNKCIIYIGDRDSFGYGRIEINYKSYKVSRLVAHFNINFDLNSDFEICHTCDNTSCINIKHLFIGTHKDNMIDAANKGKFKGRKVGALSNKTHCPQGHKYTPKNTGINQGKNYCRICHRANAKKIYRKNLQEGEDLKL